MTESGVAVRRPLSPRKFFAMLYETDAAATAEDGRRPHLGRAGDIPLHQLYGLRRPSVPVQLAAAATSDMSLQQHTVVVVRPTAAYVEHTFAAGLTAFREYIRLTGGAEFLKIDFARLKIHPQVYTLLHFEKKNCEWLICLLSKGNIGIEQCILMLITPCNLHVTSFE